MTGIPIGEVAKQVGKSVFTLRRLEAQGRIPQARREAFTYRRVWSEEQVAEMRRLLGVESPPTLAENLVNILNDAGLPDSFDGFLAMFKRLAPVIMQQAEGLLGDKTLAEAVEALQGGEVLEQAAKALLGEQATPTLVGR